MQPVRVRVGTRMMWYRCDEFIFFREKQMHPELLRNYQIAC